VTGVTVAEEIERIHFLDSLSLLDIVAVSTARHLADVGSGAGLPALVLALALPRTRVTAIESQHQKCAYIERAAEVLNLANITVRCLRAEEYGRSAGREAHDVVVSRALAALPVVAEYSLPLLRAGGTMVAMKGLISDQERTQALRALGILGADRLEAVRLDPFAGAQNRWVYMAQKIRATPDRFPRRSGIPAKRPLGEPLGE
jgi:16S rRNA (guanine527-N7)-methyltransferase